MEHQLPAKKLNRLAEHEMYLNQSHSFNGVHLSFSYWTRPIDRRFQFSPVRIYLDEADNDCNRNKSCVHLFSLFIIMTIYAFIGILAPNQIHYVLSTIFAKSILQFVE